MQALVNALYCASVDVETCAENAQGRLSWLGDEGTITRLIAAILIGQSDAWASQRARCMTRETSGSVSDNPTVSLPAVAA